MAVTLEESYAHCHALARRTGRNFYYSFLGLPRELLRAMCVLYSFMRHTDDLGDDDSRAVSEKRDLLLSWRENLQQSLSGRQADGPILPALVDVARKFDLAPEHLHAVIDGVESDLRPVHIRTFDELRAYCYQVAGAVGLCCIQIWGYRNAIARELAVDCGTAFQLTNILRDVGEDVKRGRVYLPEEDLRRFGYSPEELQRGVNDDRFRNLMKFEIERARGYYARARELEQHLSAVGRPILRAMIRIYEGLLTQIERVNYDVFGRRVRISTPRKLWIAGGAMVGRLKWGARN